MVSALCGKAKRLSTRCLPTRAPRTVAASSRSSRSFATARSRVKFLHREPLKTSGGSHDCRRFSFGRQGVFHLRLPFSDALRAGEAWRPGSYPSAIGGTESVRRQKNGAAITCRPGVQHDVLLQKVVTWPAVPSKIFTPDRSAARHADTLRELSRSAPLHGPVVGPPWPARLMKTASRLPGRRSSSATPFCARAFTGTQGDPAQVVVAAPSFAVERLDWSARQTGVPRSTHCCRKTAPSPSMCAVHRSCGCASSNSPRGRGDRVTSWCGRAITSPLMAGRLARFWTRCSPSIAAAPCRQRFPSAAMSNGGRGATPLPGGHIGTPCLPAISRGRSRGFRPPPHHASARSCGISPRRRRPPRRSGAQRASDR